MNIKLTLAALIAGILLPAPGTKAEDELKSSGRSVLEKHSDSVLFVALTVEVQISVGERNQATEGSVEVMGTVVSDDGLLVVSNSAIDLSGQVLKEVRRQVPRDIKVDVNASVKSARIILPDGAEVNAEVVLQDADFDMAFIRALAPEDGEEPPTFTAAPFAADAPRLRPLDEIIVLGRLGKNLNRAPSVKAGRIEMVVRRPRLLYRANISGLGQPVFNVEGVLTGLFLRQTSGAGAGAAIIRPVRDVLKSAAQAEPTKPVEQ